MATAFGALYSTETSQRIYQPLAAPT